jgi:hypothetical protein
LQEALDTAIQDFLARTAKWTPRWFNKPKFYILLHLLAHIRKFGPATLFATEAFESFNAVIRAKSVHSNRHAPSRDIANAFAHGNHIRHILSGARILMRIPNSTTSESVDANSQQTHSSILQTRMGWNDEIINASEAGLWRKVGNGPIGLVE